MPGWSVITGNIAGVKITLPPVATSPPVAIEPLDAGNGTVTVVTNDGSTIDGIAGATGIPVTGQQQILYNDGVNWFTLSAAPAVKAVTATTAVSTGEFVVVSPAGAVTITLPAMSSGGPVTVKNLTGAHIVTVQPYAGDSTTIDGESTFLLIDATDAATFITDGSSGWYTQSTATAVGTGEWNFKAKTTTYTAVAGDFVVDSPGGAHSITLPTPVTVGQRVAVKNLTGAHTVTVVTSDSTTIDAINGATGVPLAAQYDTLVVTFDGANWQIVSGGPVVASP